MATCAGYRQPQCAAADHIYAVIDYVILVIEEPATERQESKSGEGAFVLAERQFVRRDLFNNELVIRLVLIERTDDIIAIGGGEGISTFLTTCEIAFCVGVTGDIEP